MSANYVQKINNNAIAASETVPSSNLATTLAGKEEVSNKKQSIDDTSTIEYPSSKAVADFVNSSVSTATATYRGNYNVVSDLSLTYDATELQIATALVSAISTTPDNNDYCFVQIPTATATPTIIDHVDRYKFDGTNWAYEYTLNNSGFTAAEWAAIQSGITSSDKTTWNNHISNTTVHVTSSDKTTWNNKQDSLGIDPTGGDTTKFLNEKGQFAVPVQASGTAYEYNNEINYTNVPTSGNKDRHWFNYRNGDTNQPDPNNLLSDYYFGNRNNATNDVYLHADGFTPRIINGGNSNVLPFAKFNMTNTGTAKGFIHFKCVFIGTNNDDAMGQVDITLKIRQNEWHALGFKCVRNGGAGSLNYGDLGNYVYWSTGTTVYIGVRPGSYNAKLSVYVQYCELNGTATYTLDNYLSEVSGLAIHEGDNRDVSISKMASQTYNARSIVIENYLQIEIQRGNNHRHASITIFGDNDSYPFIANIGFQYLSSPTSGESAGFQTPPVLSMVECNNLSSNAYVPNVWYINNGSSGSSYIYCKWSSNKRLTVLLNTFAPSQILLSDVSSLPAEAVAAGNGHSIPHMNGINSQVGSSLLPVYVTSSGEVSPIGSKLVLPGASSGEGYVCAGYGSNNLAYLDANSTKTGLWCKTNINNGDANGDWVCYRDTAGNNVFNGSAESVTGINANTRNTSTYRLALGYTTTLDYDGHARAIVSLHTDSSLGNAGSGIGVTVLVSVDWKGNSTDRHVSARVLNNDGFASNIMPGIIVTTDSNDRLHFYVVLLGKSSDNANYEMKPFNYTSTYVIKLGGTMNWAWDLGHDSTSTISSEDFIFPAEDCVTYVCQPPKSVIGDGSSAADCIAYWTNYVGKGSIKTVYNNNGQEYTLLFSKSADGKYGTILRWGYRGPSAADVSRIEMLRCHNNSWLTSDWQGLSVDNATNATNATNADMVDYTHIVCGSLGSANNTIYFT